MKTQAVEKKRGSKIVKYDDCELFNFQGHVTKTGRGLTVAFAGRIIDSNNNWDADFWGNISRPEKAIPSISCPSF